MRVIWFWSLSVGERREACVLLSKVRNIILLQGP